MSSGYHQEEGITTMHSQNSLLPPQRRLSDPLASLQPLSTTAMGVPPPQQQQQQQQISPSKILRPLNPSAIAYEARTPPPQTLVGGMMPSSTTMAGGLVSGASSSTPQEGAWNLTAGGVASGVVEANGMVDLHMQQQQQHVPQAAEREFYMARALLQQAQRPALVAVLTSLLDDSPHMAPLIRHRCERAMAAVAQSGYGMSPAGHPGAAAVAQGWGGEPHAHTPSMGAHNAQYPTPLHPHLSPSSGVSPPHSSTAHHQRRSSRGGGMGGSNALGSSHRGAGSGREDELELCAAHGNMRPLKHLAYRPATGLYECVHGFHCLESSAPQSLSTTPKKDFPTVLMTSSLAPPAMMQGAYTGGGGGGGGVGAPQRSPPERLATDQDLQGDVANDDDVARLHSILQSVKQLQSQN